MQEIQSLRVRDNRPGRVPTEPRTTQSVPAYSAVVTASRRFYARSHWHGTAQGLMVSLVSVIPSSSRLLALRAPYMPQYFDTLQGTGSIQYLSFSHQRRRDVRCHIMTLVVPIISAALVPVPSLSLKLLLALEGHLNTVALLRRAPGVFKECFSTRVVGSVWESVLAAFPRTISNPLFATDTSPPRVGTHHDSTIRTFHRCTPTALGWLHYFPPIPSSQ